MVWNVEELLSYRENGFSWSVLLALSLTLHLHHVPICHPVPTPTLTTQRQTVDGCGSLVRPRHFKNTSAVCAGRGVGAGHNTSSNCHCRCHCHCHPPPPGALSKTKVAMRNLCLQLE